MKVVVKYLSIVIGTLFLLASDSRSQGTLIFNNRVPEISLDAPILVFPGVRASGSDFLAQLFAGPDEAHLAAIGDPLPFLTGDFAGYVDTSLGDLRVVSDVTPGDGVTVQIRAWSVADGQTFEEANRKNTFIGISNTFLVETGDANNPDSPSCLLLRTFDRLQRSMPTHLPVFFQV